MKARFCNAISFGLLGFYSSAVFNGNLVFLAFGFPQKYYGTFVGISEIFSTIAGVILVPMSNDVISHGY